MPEESRRLYIVIPAYNESSNIKGVIRDWYLIVEKISPASRLIIIDDGSKDNTWEIIKSEAAGRKQLIPLTKKNEGHGATVLFGYQYALSCGADYIFQTDSDGQTNPKEFWNFWEDRDKFDLIIGNRTNREDGLSRRLVTKVLKLVIRACFKIDTVDANTPFRLMKAETLEKNLQLVPAGYGLTNVLLTVIYEKKHQGVKYLPITFKQRQGGKNSVNAKNIIIIGGQAIGDFRKLNVIVDRKIQKQLDSYEESAP